VAVTSNGDFEGIGKFEGVGKSMQKKPVGEMNYYGILERAAGSMRPMAIKGDGETTVKLPFGKLPSNVDLIPNASGRRGSRNSVLSEGPEESQRRDETSVAQGTLEGGKDILKQIK